MTSAGVVKTWMEDRGFGFITEDDGTDVFVHVKQLPKGFQQLQTGVRVEFEKRQTARGMQAFNVALASEAFEGGEEGSFPDVLSEAEFLQELRVIQPSLREVHKQTFLDNARSHGWVEE